MNCKPGDLARIINTPSTRYAGFVDRIIRVVASELNEVDMPSWSYEGEKFRLPSGDTADCIPDNLLRPIRSPGDDERDENDILIPQHLKETA